MNPRLGFKFIKAILLVFFPETIRPLYLKIRFKIGNYLGKNELQNKHCVRRNLWVHARRGR